MADEQTVTETAQSEVPSLDQVYKEFNVEAEASNFQPQQQVQTQRGQAPGTAPDPVMDPTGYKTWSEKQSSFIQESLSKVEGELTNLKVERLRAKEEADIKSAVQKFKSICDHVDEDVAEVALGSKARKDPRFMAVYQNRNKNPQAWNAALAAYANEYKGKSKFQIDPQIAENQRAAKQSTQGSQTKQTEDAPKGDSSRFHNKVGRDFERAWRGYVDGSY